MGLRVTTQVVFTLSATDRGLVFRMEDEQSSYAMLSWSPTRFFLAGRALELNFEMDPTTGQAMAIRVQSQQDTFRVKRAP